MFEFKEIARENEFDPLTIRDDASFTQAYFYGHWQEMVGRKVKRFEINQREEIIGFFQVIKYELPFSKNLLYIPHAPVLRSLGEGGAVDIFLKEFRDKLFEIAKEENATFVRFDFYLPGRNSDEGDAHLSKFFKKVPFYSYQSSYFQPKFEWRVNLGKTGDELFNEMHPKTRYNIRLAEKKGIKIEIVKDNFEKYFSDFYKLLEETARRDNFSLHSKDYFQNIFKTLDSNNAFLAVARYNNNILLVNLILLYGKTAYFVFGGSSDEYKNLMAPHLSHWQGILEAKNRGCKFYNFGAVSSGNNYKEFEGISRFKKRFGGQLLEYSDSYDLIFKPIWYWLYNLRKWALNLK